MAESSNRLHVGGGGGGNNVTRLLVPQRLASGDHWLLRVPRSWMAFWNPLKRSGCRVQTIGRRGDRAGLADGLRKPAASEYPILLAARAVAVILDGRWRALMPTFCRRAGGARLDEIEAGIVPMRTSGAHPQAIPTRPAPSHVAETGRAIRAACTHRAIDFFGARQITQRSNQPSFKTCHGWQASPRSPHQDEIDPV